MDVQNLISIFWNYPERRQWALQVLRDNGKWDIANQLVYNTRKLAQPFLVSDRQRKAIFNKYGLGNISEDNFRRQSVKNVESLKKTMLQALSDMKNQKLSEQAKVLALKTFEESRSVLEDTAKNFPDAGVRELALKVAAEVMASKDVQEYLQKKKLESSLGYNSGINYHLGYRQPSWM